MEDKDIILRAKEYIQAYRKNVDTTIEARKKHDHPMIVLFLDNEAAEDGKEPVIDLDTCRNTVEALTGNFWMNYDSVAYATIKETATLQDVLGKVCDQALGDSTATDAHTLSVNIVMKTYDGAVDWLKEILTTIYKKTSFRFSNMDTYLYSLISTASLEMCEKLSEFYFSLQETLLSPEFRFSIKSLLFGDVSEVSNQPIPKTTIYNSVASNIIIINNVDKPASLNDCVVAGKSVLTGFSKADLPMETVYIIGFDIFSDTILDVFQHGSKIPPEYSFDIRNTLLRQQVGAIEAFAQECLANTKYLLRRNQLTDGLYPFKAIDAEYNNAIRDFVEINLNRRHINTLSEEQIREAFVAYLMNYFNQYGLDNTKKLAETIRAKEQQLLQGFGASNAYEAKSYQFTAREDAAVDGIIMDIIQSKVNEMISTARQVVLRYLSDPDANIVTKIDKTMRSIRDATERCKNEAIAMDNEMNMALAKRYEGAVIEKTATIQSIIKSNDIVLDVDNIDNFERTIFNFFEEHVVRTVLLGQMNSYEQDIENLSYDEAGHWLSNQLAKADLSMCVTNQTQTTRQIIMTDMTVDGNHKSKVVDLMNERAKNGDFSVLNVKGTSIFRCLSYRTVAAADDLTVLQNINRR
ncbi:MAG: hypothetical protein IJ168_00240 [Eubacterium sp.]|nr:hypothetical protein [Eubacterium sp.]